MKTERFKMWDCQPSGWDWKGESAAFVSCLESNDEVYIDLFGSNQMGHCCRLLALTRESVGKIDVNLPTDKSGGFLLLALSPAP